MINITNSHLPDRIHSCGVRRAESLLVTTQMALLRDFDRQLREMGRQIRFIGEVKGKYRKNLENLELFLAQNADHSRKDGKRCIKANAAQMVTLAEALTEYSFDLDKLTFSEIPLKLSGNGNHHDLDEPKIPGETPWIKIDNGKFPSSGLKDFFANIRDETDPHKSQALAAALGDDNTNLPVYYGHRDNLDESGFPLFNIYLENFARLTEKLQSRLTDLEEKSETLGIVFNQLGNQRREALETLGRILATRKDVRERILAS